MFLEVRNPVGGGEERDPSRRGRDLTENWEAVGAQRGEAPAGLGAPHPFPACLTEPPSPQPWVTILQPLPWTIPPPSLQPGRVKEGERCPHPHPPVPQELWVQMYLQLQTTTMRRAYNEDRQQPWGPGQLH
ncbi:uncharacterized protein ACBT57_011518 [Dama dama]